MQNKKDERYLDLCLVIFQGRAYLAIPSVEGTFKLLTFVTFYVCFKS